MSRKAYVRPKKVLSEMFRFLQILICLDHKLREHLTKLWGNFDLPAPMLRDSVAWFVTFESSPLSNSTVQYLPESMCEKDEYWVDKQLYNYTNITISDYPGEIIEVW